MTQNHLSVENVGQSSIPQKTLSNTIGGSVLSFGATSAAKSSTQNPNWKHILASRILKCKNQTTIGRYIP